MAKELKDLIDTTDKIIDGKVTSRENDAWMVPSINVLRKNKTLTLTGMATIGVDNAVSQIKMAGYYTGTVKGAFQIQVDVTIPFS